MPDFNGLLEKAAQIVSDAYAGARLGEITFRPKGVANVVEDLASWHIVFSLQNGRAIITCEAGRFGAPVFLDGLLVGDLMLHLPIRKTLADAFGILRAADITRPVKCVVLRHDLNLGPSGSDEPLYRFELRNSAEQVLIGSETGALSYWSPTAN